MTEREQLLNRVRMYDFALVDVSLYLDGHPHNASALAYYQKNRKLLNEAKAAYEARFGPLSRKNSTDETEWTWINDPWPWEGADN
ncbi:spore coat protein CotJB [Intestinibacillus massiliensis]|uniref:spore coat protein CotJB n=1 Tax=Intestinibacillus massiliensis TaxID=1871029 RepID=UPI000B36183D|nr:spore coat protein CotJB [Intestinibacillus massiliensis]MCB6366868.1 spore coat protein CotJB [Intestinibacillus massiliensis]